MADTAMEATLIEYKNTVTNDIETCVSEMGCQPILFVGSGLSKRYFSGPSWDELLSILAQRCPLIEKDYAYYKQTFKNPAAIGKEFAHLYQEWAWGAGKDQFPPEMFTSDVPAEAYIKFVIAKLLMELTPPSISAIQDGKLQAEIKALQGIRPHALITTNYDQVR